MWEGGGFDLTMVWAAATTLGTIVVRVEGPSGEATVACCYQGLSGAELGASVNGRHRPELKVAGCGVMPAGAVDIAISGQGWPLAEHAGDGVGAMLGGVAGAKEPLNLYKIKYDCPC